MSRLWLDIDALRRWHDACSAYLVPIGEATDLVPIGEATDLDVEVIVL